jgi:hypothetical protein
MAPPCPLRASTPKHSSAPTRFIPSLHAPPPFFVSAGAATAAKQGPFIRSLTVWAWCASVPVHSCRVHGHVGTP